jgi:hypothetical protein
MYIFYLNILSEYITDNEMLIYSERLAAMDLSMERIPLGMHIYFFYLGLMNSYIEINKINTLSIETNKRIKDNIVTFLSYPHLYSPCNSAEEIEEFLTHDFYEQYEPYCPYPLSIIYIKNILQYVGYK